MNPMLGSASQSSATAIEHKDNLLSPKIDKADTNLSFYSMCSEYQLMISASAEIALCS